MTREEELKELKYREDFRESTISELKEALPEMADSIYEVAEKMDEFFELIEKKIMENANKQAEEFAND